jgi:lysophospholipase L1-like esterase
MRTLMAAAMSAALAITLVTPGIAADEGACFVAGNLVQADFALQHVAAAIAAKRLNVAVLGSASSSLPGAAGAANAYPARLEASLTRRLPGVAVKVVPHAKARETAADMVKTLRQVLQDEKPDVVVWQTGTVDAMLGVDPDQFQAALAEGLDALRDNKADAIFMNMQYSPRTDSMIAMGAYVEAMRFIAVQREILLFDRLAVMNDWNEMGVFDLSAATKKIDVAERVHDCIGRLLSRLIVDGANLAHASNTGAGPMETPHRESH